MTGARPRYLIVDGHSVIHSWGDLRALHQREPRLARIELEQRLSGLQDSGGERVVLVFDGRGSSTQSSRQRPVDIQVVYAGGGATADAVIERLVAAHVATHDLTVITADEAERLTISALGAWWMSPDLLRERIDGVRRDLEREMKRKR